MSIISRNKYSWYEKLGIKVVRAGAHLPQHVGIIMDGNRRFAKLESIAENQAHVQGFHKLKKIINLCVDLGIPEVSVFGFSIENFKRTKNEVTSILNLVHEQTKKMLYDDEEIMELGLKMHIYGNMSLLPYDIQDVLTKLMIATKNNNRLILNLALSYTSREEITQAVETILKHGNELEPEDIDESLITKCLYTKNSLPLDMVIRTSNETRLSDFFMWQQVNTIIIFNSVLWPQLTTRNFLSILLTYHRAKLYMNDCNYVQVLEKKSYSGWLQRVENFFKSINSYEL